MNTFSSRIKMTVTVAATIAGGFSASAQSPAKDTLIRTNTIEVIQSYRPEVKQAPKPEFTPGLPPADTSRPRLNYTVPPQTLFFNYHSSPLKPLALGKDSVDIPFANYIKIGGGNLATVYVDAGIGGLKGENYSSAIYIHHISQSGDIENQKTALSGIEADGWLNTAKSIFHLGVNAERNQFSFYGYNHDSLKLKADSTKQVFTGVHILFGMKANDVASRKFSASPGINFGLYGDKYNSNETSLVFNMPMGQAIDSNLSYQVDARVSYIYIKTNKKGSENYQLQIKPGVRYNKGIFEGFAGLYPTVSADNAYLLPDVRIGIHIPNSQFIIAGGWQENLIQNTYESLTSRNPWFLAAIPGVFSQFGETQTHKKEVYGEIQSNISNHFSFSGRFSWLEWDDMVMFLNASNAEMYFYNAGALKPNNVKAYSIQANIRYHIANTLVLGLSANWLNYYEKPYAQVWHEPAMQMKADLVFHPVPEFTLTAYSLVLDGIHAVDSVTGKDRKLKGILDIGAGAEYSFIPRLSAFLNVNNLLNNKNERWYGYPSYGFNIYGGLRLKF